MTTPTLTPPCLGEREAVARTALAELTERVWRRLGEGIGEREMHEAIMRDVSLTLHEEASTLRTENETLRADLATEEALARDNAAVSARWRARALTAEAEREAAIARAEEAERRLAERPLTAAALADALHCFANAAIGAMHTGTATECAIAQGLDAVAWRLEEISKETKP